MLNVFWNFKYAICPYDRRMPTPWHRGDIKKENTRGERELVNYALEKKRTTRTTNVFSFSLSFFVIYLTRANLFPVGVMYSYNGLDYLRSTCRTHENQLCILPVNLKTFTIKSPLVTNV